MHFSPMYATCSAHPILLDLTVLITVCEGYKFQSELDVHTGQTVVNHQDASDKQSHLGREEYADQTADGRLT
jgi:hypothetical protein